MEMTGFDKNLFEQNLLVMRSCFKMEYNSMHGIGALLYTMEGRAADEDHLRETRKILKKHEGIFSEFRGHLSLPIIVKMSLAPDAELYLQGISGTYKKLSTSFILGDESRLLAAIILHDHISQEKIDDVCGRTMEIYSMIRKNHPLLTSQQDLPFAVLMAAEDVDTDEQIRDVEACYELVGKHFRMSKDSVQTVSHLLAIQAAPAQEKSERFLQMFEAFKAAGIKISKECMPILAVLVNTGLPIREAVRQTQENDAFLKTQKGFGIMGTGTEIRRLFAAGITAVCNTAGDPAVFGTLSETILSIIIAIEIAVMITVIVSTSTAASTHN